MWTRVQTLFMGVWGLLNFLRRAIANVVLFILLLGLVIWLVYDPKPSIPAKSYLHLNLSGEIVEQSAAGGTQQRLLGALQGTEPQTTLSDVIEALRLAAKDSAIEGVYMSLSDLDRAGMASIREIGEAMQSFRKSGKKITVWSSSFTQRQYAIAAYANEVYLHPMGQVLLPGFSSQRFYWGDLLRKAGVTVHVFKAGAYKTFPEPFVLNAPSKESLQADAYWMQDEWQQVVEAIQEARGLVPGSVQKYVDQLPEELKDAKGSLSQVAVNANLVDAIMTQDEVLDVLVTRQGGRAGKDRLKTVELSDYLHARNESSESGKGVALVTIDGEIVDGVGAMGQAGARTIVRELRDARRDDQIAALVVRVNSPGGSAVASEMIRREIELVKKAGKPVVVSIGNYGASGGYWVSLAADRIVVDPSSITGSIGVFGMMPTFEKALEKFQVGTGGVSTTWLAQTQNMMLPMNPRFQSMMELSVARIYEEFIQKVADARHLSIATVGDLAQGRVYTGRQAQKLGLADTLGGIKTALDEARRLSKLPENAPIVPFMEEEETVFHVVNRVLLSASVRMLGDSWMSALGIPSKALQATEYDAQRLLGLVKSPSDPLAHCLCASP